MEEGETKSTEILVFFTVYISSLGSDVERHSVAAKGEEKQKIASPTPGSFLQVKHGGTFCFLSDFFAYRLGSL